jgi:site-specific recombinase XerD
MTDSMLAVSQSDFARLLAACDLRTWHGVRDYAILLLLYDTGIRRGELLAMRLGDVEAVDRAASVVSGKSGTRAVGMGTAARRAVRDYLTRARYAVPTDHDALWITRTGEPLGPRGVGKLIDRLKAAAGIEGRIYPHKLRHTFSTEFLRNGGNAYTLQVALGHTSPVVTSNYVHLAAADVERAMQTFSPADALAKRRR